MLDKWATWEFPNQKRFERTERTGWIAQNIKAIARHDILKNITTSKLFCFCRSKNAVRIWYVSTSEVLIFAQIKLHWCTALVGPKFKFKLSWIIDLKCCIINFLNLSSTRINNSNKCIVKQIIDECCSTYCISS